MKSKMSFKDAVSLVEGVSRQRATRTVAADWSLVQQLAQHWGVTSETARKRLYRAKQYEEGVVAKQIFIHEEDWPSIKNFIAEVGRKRKAKERVDSIVAANASAPAQTISP